MAYLPIRQKGPVATGFPRTAQSPSHRGPIDVVKNDLAQVAAAWNKYRSTRSRDAVYPLLDRRRIRLDPKATTPKPPATGGGEDKRSKNPIKSHNEHDGVLQHIQGAHRKTFAHFDHYGFGPEADLGGQILPRRIIAITNNLSRTHWELRALDSGANSKV